MVPYATSLTFTCGKSILSIVPEKYVRKAITIKNVIPKRIEYFFNLSFFISATPNFYRPEQTVNQYLFARTNKSVMPES